MNNPLLPNPETNPAQTLQLRKGCWRKLLAPGLAIGLALFLQPARAQTIVLDDDFNDFSGTLGLNTGGSAVGHGFTIFQAGGNGAGYFVNESGGNMQLSSSPNGASRESVCSIDAIGLNAGGTLFDFRNVSFANQTLNTSTATAPADRVMVGVINRAPAGDYLEAGTAAIPAGFWIQFNSDSEASGSGNGTWDGNSTLFYCDGAGNRTVLSTWKFDHLGWSLGGSGNFAPVLDIQLTIGATSVTLNITGDTQGGGSPVSFTNSYANFGINPVLLNGLTKSFVMAENQSENPGIFLSVDRLVVTELGQLAVETPQISTPEYSTNTAVINAGEALQLSAVVLDSGTPTLQWQVSDEANPGSFTNLPSGNGTNVIVDTTSFNDGTPRQFQLVATDGFNSVTSAVVSVTVNPGQPPYLVTDTTPNPAYAEQGLSVNFTAAFGGNLPTFYQWQASPDDSTWTNIPSSINPTATNQILVLQNVSTSSDGFYRLVASNSVSLTQGTAASSGAQLVVTATAPQYLWGSPVSFNGLGADQILTNFPNTKIAGAMLAQNGGNPVTVTNGGSDQPIVFAGAGAWATLSGGAGYTTGASTNGPALNNANFQTCLNDKYYDGATSMHNISLSGLVVGQKYSVQLFALDDSTQTPDETLRTVNWQDPADGSDISSTYSMAANDYIVGTFTASNSVQTIQENLLNTSDGNFNCLVLRAVGWTPPPYFTTEPVAGAAKYPGAGVSVALNGASAAGDATIASPTITYQWQSGPAGGPYVNLAEGAKYVGTTTTNLVINNLAAADGVPVYVLAASNGGGTTLSRPVTVNILTPPAAGSYAAYAVSNNPVAFWPLTETNDPSVGGVLALDISGNGFNGTYGASALDAFDNILSPQPPAFPGFATGQGALQSVSGTTASLVTLPNLTFSTSNTTNCTMAMWIYPTATPVAYTGLLFNRNGTDGADGFGFSGTTANGLTSLGYTWNNNSQATWGWNSGLFPPLNTWSFVALVTSSSNAVVYLDYQDPNTGLYQLLSATNNVASTGETFGGGGTFEIGGDSVAGTTRIFTGDISEVGMYTNGLSAAQLAQMYEAGLGVQGFAPVITTQPQPDDTFLTSPAQFSVGVSGTGPFAYQWQLNNVNLTNGVGYYGVTNATLIISNVTAGYAGNYRVVITNLFGTVTSSNAALVILPPALVGQWLNGTSTNLTDESGYSPAGTHDAYAIGAGNFVFTNDVPPGQPATNLSLLFFNGDTGLAVSNSSTLDANYVNTFDNPIQQNFSFTLWAKGFPGNWGPWVSKYGETTPTPAGGWQLREDGSTGSTYACLTCRNGGKGTVTLGAAVYGSSDDMATRTFPSNDGQWHHYVGTLNAFTGVRALYVDGTLAASESNNVAYMLAAAEHLCIGAKDSPPGNTFGNFFTGQLYDVRIYNYSISQAYIQTNVMGNIPPEIVVQPPAALSGVQGSTVQAVASLNSIAGTAPLAYQWQLNGVSLANNASYSGVNSNILSIKLAANLAGNAYDLVITNLYGSTLSSNVVVSVIVPTPGSYAAYVVSNSPVGFWPLNDTNDPSTGTALAVDISGSGLTGTYQASALNGFDGILAPQPPAYPGFASGQGALQTKQGTLASTVKLPNLNLNTNTVTIAMWIFPTNNAGTSTGLFFNRGGSGADSAVGFGFGGNKNASGMAELGYTWNNTSATYNYHSALYPPTNVWSYVALVTTPSNAVIYLNYQDANGYHQLAATNAVVPTPNATFSGGTLLIGGDQNASSRVFNGNISGAAMYNYSVNAAQLTQMYQAGLGIGGFPPAIVTQPVSIYVPAPTLANQKVTFTAVLGGTGPITNGWKFNGTTLADGPYLGATIYGSQTASLTISNITASNVGSYQLFSSSAFGTTNSSVVTLTILPATLVGQWVYGVQNYSDVSGYSPAGTHDGFLQNGGTYWTNDVPAVAPVGSYSLYINNGGLRISNSATLDANYTNTFDNQVYNGLTVMCWAKGFPGTWNPWVSKYGEGPGWQLRINTSGPDSAWTVRDNNNGDMTANRGSNDGNWHHYAGTYSPVTGVRTLYVDGVVVAQQTGETAYSSASAYRLMIGAKDSGNASYGNYFTGRIYDVRIYNYALSQGDVANIVGLPEPQTRYVTAGEVAKFNPTGINAAPPYTGYQWTFNGANLSDGAYLGAVISGSGTLSLTVSNATLNNAGLYQLLVTNASGVASNTIVKLTVLQPALVGRWLSGAVSNLTDVSGFSPAGTHDAAVQSGSVIWTNDVPAYAPGGSYSLYFAAAGLTVSNSSAWDAAYTNTFDAEINNDLTVMCWAKGFPGTWNPWVSKNGDSGNSLPVNGWQVRSYNAGPDSAFTVRGTGGAEDLAATIGSNDGQWHQYTGTYSASTGVRTLYVDGQLAATESGQGPETPSRASHLMIGGQDNGGAGTNIVGTTSSVGKYFTGEIYDVRIYNYALSQAQLAAVVPGLKPTLTTQFLGANGVNGNNSGQLNLSWPFGTLRSATNVMGPYLPVAGATSPYTNFLDPTIPQLFFRLSNP